MSSRKHKKKVESESSDSDSGPDDVVPPQSKKSKSKGESSAIVTDEGDTMFPLSKTRFVKVREFKGKILIDIREYYESNGDLKPGKKGICLSVEQYQALKNVLPEVDEALSKK